jgi:retron-type reverse transcriptase
MGLPQALKGSWQQRDRSTKAGLLQIGVVRPDEGRRPGSHIRSITSVAGSSSTVSTDSVKKLQKIYNLCINNNNFVVKDKIYNLMYDPQLYFIAYQKLRIKPGNMTPGITPTTLDGMSNEVINDIIRRLKDGTFKFSLLVPASLRGPRRIYIPKANGGSRPLTIAPPRDKLVLEAMRQILETIFEPSFRESSHGFRPGRSCHTALKEIRNKFGVAN